MQRDNCSTWYRFRTGLLVISIALLSLLLSNDYVLAKDAASLRNINNGDKVPSITLPTIKDETLQSLTLDNGKPNVLIFFSIRPDFRKNRSLALLSTLSNLADTYKTEINIIGIYSDEKEIYTVKSFIEKSARNIKVFLDRDKVIYSQYGVVMMPLVVLTDADGRLHEVIPYTYRIRDFVEGNIKLLLGEWDRDTFISSLKPKHTEIKSNKEKEYIRRVNYGRVMLSKKMYGSAIREFSNASKLMPQLISAHIGLGYAFLGSENYNGAEASFREAIKVNPESDEAIAGLGLAYYRRGQVEPALIELEKAFISSDPLLEVVIALAEIYEQKGLDKKANRFNKLAVTRLMSVYNQRWK
jgi:tetratricopeptide (TPR) repeat protein